MKHFKVRGFLILTTSEMEPLEKKPFQPGDDIQRSKCCLCVPDSNGESQKKTGNNIAVGGGLPVWKQMPSVSTPTPPSPSLFST